MTPPSPPRPARGPSSTRPGLAPPTRTWWPLRAAWTRPEPASRARRQRSTRRSTAPPTPTSPALRPRRTQLRPTCRQRRRGWPPSARPHRRIFRRPAWPLPARRLGWSAPRLSSTNFRPGPRPRTSRCNKRRCVRPSWRSDRRRSIWRTLILVAPFDGVVAAINAKVGEQAPGGGDAVQVLTNQRDVRTDTTVDRSERPVVAFYGSVPLYRTLHDGVEGADVRQLEENLAELGYTGLTADGTYTSAVAMAVRKWQADLGLPETGTVEPGQVVFTPGPVRIAEDTARVGDAIGGNSGASVAAGSARPSEAGASGRGVAVLSYTGATKLVTVQLGVADQALAVVGRKAAVSVPGQQAVEGQISQVDSVLTAASTTPVPSGPSSAASAARIKVDVAIADQEALGSLGGAPVDVDFVVDERKDVVAVPVAAHLALPGGRFGLAIGGG